MKFINEELFPLAKFLVINQSRKFGTTIKNVIIIDDPDAKTAGYYDPERKDICLNIGTLNNPEIILRYGIPKKEEENEHEYSIRLGAAILFEECYHASKHGTELNTEELATEYGKTQAEKLPRAILTKNEKKEEKKETALTKDNEPPDEVPWDDENIQEKTIIPLVSGGMVDFISEISKKSEMNTTIPARYGSIEIVNDKHSASIKHITDANKLNEAKKTLGNVTKLGIEYAGMIYAYEHETWKTFVDIDRTRMVETEITKPTEIYLTKTEGKDPLIELKR